MAGGRLGEGGAHLGMRPWSEQEERVLFEQGHRGARKCAEIIRAECGTRRSPQAVQRHASRIGASMERYDVCPVCGAKVRRLVPRSGLCARCNYRHLAEANRQARMRLEDARPGFEADARRKYQAERNRRIRAEEKLRSTDHGDFAKTSDQMSNPRSEGQEFFGEEPREGTGKAGSAPSRG